MKVSPDTSQPEGATDFFRCPVQPDQGDAKILIGRRRVRACVQETSIDGFTVLIAPQEAPRLKVGKLWVLQYSGARFEVHPQWFFHAPDGHVQMGLRRMRDLTEPEKIGSWAPFGKTSRQDDSRNSTLVFAGLVLLLFTAMALPGLGDQLGTAARIHASFRWVIHGLERQMDRMF